MNAGVIVPGLHPEMSMDAVIAFLLEHNHFSKICGTVVVKYHCSWLANISTPFLPSLLWVQEFVFVSLDSTFQPTIASEGNLAKLA